MHFAALAVGRRLGARPVAGYYREQRRGHAGACCARWSRRGGGAIRLLVDGGRLRRAGRDADHRGAPDAPDQRRTARRSWPSSARCRTSSGAYGLRSVALRYFNAAGADPDGELGEDHRPETHLIPLAIDAALGRRAAARVRRRLPDAGRHVPARLHPRHRPGRRRTCWRWRALEARRRVGRYNLGNGAAVLGAGGDRVGRAGERAAACRGRPAPRRDGRPAVLFASSARIRRDLGWTPRSRSSTTSCETAWRWRAAHPHGYGDRTERLMSRLKGVLADPLLSVVMPVYNERTRSRRSSRRVLGGAGAHRDHRRRRLLDRRHARRCWRALQARSCGSGWSCRSATRARGRRCAAGSRRSPATWSSSRTPTSSTRRRSTRT